MFVVDLRAKYRRSKMMMESDGEEVSVRRVARTKADGYRFID